MKTFPRLRPSHATATAFALLAWTAPLHAQIQVSGDPEFINNDPVLSIHVQNRLGYGPSPEGTAYIAAHGVGDWIDRNLAADFDDSGNSRLQALLALLETPSFNEQKTDFNIEQPGSLNRRLQRIQIARALYSRNQLVEQMTNFWEQHFNVNHKDARLELKRLLALNDKEAFNLAGYFAWLENVRFRAGALGAFEDLLLESALGPSMMVYLDTATSKASGPNENYARELLELHTVGVGAHDEHDVTAVAKCLTGLEIRMVNPNRYGDPLAELHEDPAAWFAFGDVDLDGKVKLNDLFTVTDRFGTTDPAGDVNGDGVVDMADVDIVANNFGKLSWVYGPWFNEADYSPGEKIVFAGAPDEIRVGGASITREQKYGEIVTLLTALARSQRTARYLSAKLTAKFVSPQDPDRLDVWPFNLKNLAEAGAAAWTQTGGDIRETLEVLLTSNVFLNNPNHRWSKTETPFESAVSAIRAFEVDDSGPGAVQDEATLETLRETIEDRAFHSFFLVRPPDGYPENRAPGSGNLLALMKANEANASALAFDWGTLIPPGSPPNTASIAAGALQLLYGPNGYSQTDLDLATAFLDDYLADQPAASHGALCAHLAKLAASMPRGFQQ